MDPSQTQREQGTSGTACPGQDSSQAQRHPLHTKGTEARQCLQELGGGKCIKTEGRLSPWGTP